MRNKSGSRATCTLTMSKRKDQCSCCGGEKDYRANLCLLCSGKGITERQHADKVERVLAFSGDSDTISGIAKLSGTSRKFVKAVLENSGFDFTLLRATRCRMPVDSHIFFIGDKRRNSTVLQYIRRHNLLEDCCNVCGIGNTWQDKPLKLQLDHIDGNPFNNLFDNLRILCPNCHTQTDTFTGRNIK